MAWSSARRERQFQGGQLFAIAPLAIDVVDLVGERGHRQPALQVFQHLATVPLRQSQSLSAKLGGSPRTGIAARHGRRENFRRRVSNGPGRGVVPHVGEMDVIIEKILPGNSIGGVAAQNLHGINELNALRSVSLGRFRDDCVEARVGADTKSIQVESALEAWPRMVGLVFGPGGTVPCGIAVRRRLDRFRRRPHTEPRRPPSGLWPATRPRRHGGFSRPAFVDRRRAWQGRTQTERNPSNCPRRCRE